MKRCIRILYSTNYILQYEYTIYLLIVLSQWKMKIFKYNFFKLLLLSNVGQVLDKDFFVLIYFIVLLKNECKHFEIKLSTYINI